MPFVHISDEPLATTTAAGDLYVFDRPGTPYVTYKVAAASIATYVSGAIAGTYVPYTGASANVDLGVHALTVGGQLAFGSGTFDSSSEVTLRPTAASTYNRGLYVIGALNGAAFNRQSAIEVGLSFQLTQSITTAAAFSAYVTSFNAGTGNTLTNAASFYASPNLLPNTGTITNSIGFYYDGGFSGSGTVTNGYGALFKTPNAGTFAVGCYTDSLCVGVPNLTTAPPSGGMLVAGSALIGSSSVASSNVFFTVSPTVTAASGAAYGTFLGNGQINAAAAFDTLNCVAVLNTTLNTAGFTGLTVNLLNLNAGSMAVTGGGTVQTAVGLSVSGISSKAVQQYGIKTRAPTGGTVNIAAYTDNLVVGSSFLVTNPSANGAIIQGQVGVGAFTLTGNTLTVTATATEYYTQTINGTILVTDSGVASGAQMGLRVTPTFRPTTNPAASSAVYGAYISGTFGPAGGTLTNAYSLYVSSLYTSNAATIGTAYGIYYDGGGTLPAGSLGESYGLYVKQPIAATSRYTAYFDPIVAIGATPDVNRIFLVRGSGLVDGIRFNPSLSTSTNAVNNVMFRSEGTLTTTAAGTTSYGLFNNPTFTSTGSGTYTSIIALSAGMTVNGVAGTWSNAYSLYTSGNFANLAGAITTIRAIYYDGGTAITGGGSIGSHYAMYITRPTAGTNRYTAYFDPIVGIGVLPSADRILYIGGDVTNTINNTGIVLSPSVGATSGTVATCGAMNISAGFSSNVGTVTSGYGLNIGAGSTAGTITNGYGLFASNPAYGASSKAAIYGDNLVIGSPFATTSPPSGGAIISGAVAVGVSSAASTTQLTVSTTLGIGLKLIGTQTGDDGAETQAINVGCTLNPATTARNTYGIGIAAIHIAGAAKTIPIASGIYVYNQLSSNVGTITNAAGIYIDSGSTSTGTVVNGFGLFVAMPGFGTTKVCAAFAGGIQITTNSTGSRSCTLGANGPSISVTPTTWEPCVTAAGLNGWKPIWV